MSFVLSIPAVLSLLVLAAHFLHNDSGWLPVVVSIALCGLLFSRNRWLLYAVQTVLILAAIEWVFTAQGLAQERQQMGLPWIRSAIILVSVALFNVAAAAMLRWRKKA